MIKQQIAQGDDLWKQIFGLASGLRAVTDPEGRMFVEKTGTSDKFLLQPWQMAFMAAFEPVRKTVAEVVRDLIPKFPGQVTEPGVREFCEWLAQERLIELPQDQPFSPIAKFPQPVPVGTPAPKPAQELPPIAQPSQKEIEPPINPIAQSTMAPPEQISLAPTQAGGRSTGGRVMGNLLKIAACIFVGLGTWKFSDTILPFLNDQGGETRMLVGANAIETSSATASAAMGGPVIQSEVGSKAESADEAGNIFNIEKALSELRLELAETQEQRDRCYDTDDEVGYRLAVKKIAHLTHEIGLKQAELSTGTLEKAGVAYGADSESL